MLLQRVGLRTSRGIGVVAALVALVAGSLGAIADTATRATPAGAVGTPSRVITYEVRGLDNGSDLESFAAQAAETYADPRGWSLGGSVAFVRVPSGGSFTLWLAAPGRVPGFGSPCSSLYSCRQGRNVIINEARWLGASPSWNAAGAALRDYRHMVVNHETGHWIGFGHAGCGGPGAPAPVMQQQSISLQGCAPNSWPLDSERHATAARLGVEIRYGNPFGALEQVQPWLHAVRVIGWAIDPDTAAPDVVQITVDGASSFVGAPATRHDVAAAYPGYGPAHGFNTTIPAANGQHSVCAYALNISGGGNTALLGCRTVVVGSPFGAVEHLDSGPRIARVSGWVIDPDTAASTSVHVYVNGVATAVPANRTRADVGGSFPGLGNEHGFDQLVAAPSGANQVCVYGINLAGVGTNSTLGCRSLMVGGAPFGAVDAMRTGPGQIRVSGWVIDRDLATPGRVHVYVDGAATPVQADKPRPSVGAAYPLYGANHGFDRVVNATPGRHQVCVYGIDLSGPGDNTTLACRTVVVGGAPFGALDAVQTGAGQLRVTGWEIDPDTAAPGRVHVYVDGVATVATAGNPRGDIAAAYPLYGAGHGYDVTIPALAGYHGVCAYGINSAGPGGNTTLGCRTVRVTIP
jgi:hypothetical protein